MENDVSVAQNSVTQTEEKVLITPDVEKVIKKLMAMPLQILQMSAKTAGGAKSSKTKELYFNDRGLHIEIVNGQGSDKFIIPFDQLNRIISIVKQ